MAKNLPPIFRVGSENVGKDHNPSFALTCIKKLHFFQCLQDFTPAMVLYFEYVT